MSICDIRVNQLEQMHNIILNINNEDMYEDWMMLLHEESFNNIAESDGFYNECLTLFSELVTDVGYWH